MAPTVTYVNLYKNKEKSNDFNLFWCYVYGVWQKQKSRNFCYYEFTI